MDAGPARPTWFLNEDFISIGVLGECVEDSGNAKALQQPGSLSTPAVVVDPDQTGRDTMCEFRSGQDLLKRADVAQDGGPARGDLAQFHHRLDDLRLPDRSRSPQRPVEVRRLDDVRVGYRPMRSYPFRLMNSAAVRPSPLTPKTQTNAFRMAC